MDLNFIPDFLAFLKCFNYNIQNYEFSGWTLLTPIMLFLHWRWWKIRSSITFSFLSVDSFDKTIFSQTNVDNVISAAQIAENYIQANGSQLVTDVSDKFTRFRNLSFTLDYLYK